MVQRTCGMINGDIVVAVGRCTNMHPMPMRKMGIIRLLLLVSKFCKIYIDMSMQLTGYDIIMQLK